MSGDDEDRTRGVAGLTTAPSAPAPKRSPLRPGSVVGDRFQLQQLAGQGGMALVYEATDLRTGETVALKLLRDVACRRRFAREVSHLAKLEHPAIVRHVAHGALEDGSPWLVMDWIDGVDLALRLARGPLPIDECVALIKRLAGALDAAHGRGIVHRDIKPANIQLGDGNATQAFLLDFGIAREVDGGLGLTRTGALVGTVGYMAPEQARGEREVDARADIFSLGCVIYECLTGRPAFHGDHAVAVLTQVLMEKPADPRDRRPECPRHLAQLVMRMLEKDARNRPADGAAVLAALASDEPGDLGEVDQLTGAERRPRAFIVVSSSRLALAPTLSSDTRAPRRPPLEQIVQTHGGLLLELVDGSSVAVLDTAPRETLRDLAVRAVRAAKAILEQTPEARAGIAIGSAEVRGSLAMGPIVDRAAGLIAGVDAHAAVVDATIERLVGDAFMAAEGLHKHDPEGELSLVQTTQRPAPLFGRKRERSFLEALLAESEEESVANAAVVVGEAGLGKSRICREMIEVAGERGFDVAVVRSDPVYGTSSLNLLRQLASLQGCAALHDALTHRGEILDEGSSNRIEDALAACLAAQLQHGPLLLVLEDLQWADERSVNMFTRALLRLGDTPLVLVATTRPEIAQRVDAALMGAEVQRLRLKPLRPPVARRLLESIVGGLDDDRAADLVDKAQGNAFVLKELAQHELSGGGGELPVSALAIAHSRLDRLAPDARRVLRAGAVFGESFWLGAVAALTQSEPEIVEPKLAALVRDDILRVNSSGRFEGERELRFRHGLLREAAYATLTVRDRTLGHRLAAEWLTQSDEPSPLVIGEHWDKAGEPGRAAHFFVQAADEMFSLGDLRRALDVAARIHAAPADVALSGDVSRLRAMALAFSHEPQEAGREALAALSKLPRGSAGWLEAGYALAYAVVCGAGEHADALLEHVRPPPEVTVDPRSVKAMVRLVMALVNLGERDAVLHLVAACERSRPLDRVSEAFVELAISFAASFSILAPERAIPAAERALALLNAHLRGDPINTAVAHHVYGLALLANRSSVEALAVLREAHARFIAARSFMFACYSQLFIGLTLLASDQLDESRERLESLRETPDATIRQSALNGLARLWLREGDIARAERELQHAAPLVQSAVSLGPLRHTQAVVASRRGDRERARELAEHAVELCRRAGMPPTRAAVERLRERLDA